jgi:hypothetical protein
MIKWKWLGPVIFPEFSWRTKENGKKPSSEYLDSKIKI